MRTDPAEPSPSISNRLRTRAAEGVSRFSGLPPLGRLAMLCLLAAIAGLVGYGILSQNPTGGEISGREWLYDGHRFSQDEVARITKVLEASQLDPVTDGGRIGVLRARMVEARSLIGKAGLGPRRPSEIIDEPETTNWLGSFTDAEKRRDQRQEKFLKTAIDGLDPKLGATVQIHRKRSSGMGRPTESVEVHVYLDVEGGQRINSRDVEAIKNLMLALEPDLKPEGLHLIDRMGNVYLSPTNPSLGHRSRARAREEELTDKIATTLSWIRDLRVTVTIDPEAPAAAPPPEAEVVETVRGPISANQPLEADEPPAEPAPEVVVEADDGSGRIGKATVFLQFPVSYVVQRFHLVHGNSRRPTREDLEPIFHQVRNDLGEKVRNIVPEAELARVEVDKFDTDMPPLAEAPPVSTRLVPRPWWIPAALSGAVAALALAAFAGWWAARRPEGRPRPSAAQRPSRRLVPAPSSPSERVRELIRIDPAAAAGVLHRWIGQSTGGRDA